ncbi:MAG: methionine--tRNA ligase [Promicromonosporaceae bacterium]|nr:methionine--tRNA ligase [Promicromonosporaceae bacterium]
MSRHLVTSALPYINGVKHLGNMVGSILPADIYSRYLRARGHEVLYICATDEHGTPAELAAAEAGLPVAEFCAQAHDLQKSIYDGFDIGFDYFGRSSSVQNAELTQHFARKLNENGFIEERTLEQVYSPTDGRFLPDRYVEGTCPKCGSEQARGDQCENCTSVLEPTDLVNPHSAISGAQDLEIRQTKHLYLLQSKLQPAVEQWIAENSGSWPLLSTSIAKKWLTEGLQDRAITRDLEWGVPVPADTWPELAAEGKVFYVWFDAPIEYIGATREWADSNLASGTTSSAVSNAETTPEMDAGWRRWWRLDDGATDVNYSQFMAKDNVPFHTVMFPATELGTREPWKMVDYVKGFSWLTYYGGKFSTSQKRGIFTDAALELWPADYWRYYLIATAPESDDSEFTWENFAAIVNKDLADTLGNFVNRVLTFTAKKYGQKVPEGGVAGEAEEKLAVEVTRLLGELETALDRMEFRKAAQALRALWSAGNVYLVEKEPWKQAKTDPEAAALSLRTAMNLIWLYGIVSAPFIPATAARLRSIFAESGVESAASNPGWISGAHALDSLKPGSPFELPGMLFTKITDDDVASYIARFGGRDPEPA